MNSPFNNIVAVCKLKVTSKDKQQKGKPQLTNESLDIFPEQDKTDVHDEEIDIEYLNSIDLESISLSTSEQKMIDKFYIRKNFALALTKKKEPLFWGQIVESKRLSLNLQFIDVISETCLNQDYGNDENKHNFLCKRISFFKNIRISEICCNDFAAHFLSEDGMLYSMGNDHKKYGLLGMGAVYEASTPQLNNSLIDFRISKISMGLSHCCVLTTGKQLYSWGTGQNGQLCLNDDTMFSNQPKLVPNSKSLNILNIYCSNYYTLLINTQGQLIMYGTLKGFAKFLFDSPSRDSLKNTDNSNTSSLNHSRISDTTKFKLNLGNEVISKVSIAEKAFAVYCQNTHNLYFVNDNFQAECILRREIKSFQFLNGQKYLVAQDTNNILIVMTQQDVLQSSFTQHNKSQTEHTQQKWQIIKEFNLIQVFNLQDVELLPQDTSISTKKAQSLQLLTFITQTTHSKQLVNNFNKKYYKTFLISSQVHMSHNDAENSALSDSNFGLKNQKRYCQSPYSSFGSSFNDNGTTRNKLKIKIDSMFGSTFSAQKGRSNSTSIKERAKKLHQSLSPVQRFPIINNLCEIIKKQKLQMDSKSPPKLGHANNAQSVNDAQFSLKNLNRNYQDQMNTPQYNIFLQSLNLACQLSNIGNPADLQSAKQVQFLSKADKIRQDLNKKAVVNQSQVIYQQQDSIKLQSQINQTNAKNNALDEDSFKKECEKYNLPLQMQHENTSKEYELPVQLNDKQIAAKQHQSKNLSCILEDFENTSFVQAQAQKDGTKQKLKKGQNQRTTSIGMPDYPPKLLSSHVKQQQDIRNMLNIDTISEITMHGRDSMHRFSQASELTNTNSYKILVMNARAVIEKKVLQHLMVGFMQIKYFQQNSFQSFQLQSTLNYSQNLDKTLKISHIDINEQRNQQLQTILTKIYQRQLESVYERVETHCQEIKEKKKCFKKLGFIVKQKQEQMLLDSLRKIQLSIRFKKLQRLNINLLFNSFNKLLKKQQKAGLQNALDLLKNNASQLKQSHSVQLIIAIFKKHFISKAFKLFNQNAQLKTKMLKGITILNKIHDEMIQRKSLNQKAQALYTFKRNSLFYQEHRTQVFGTLITKIHSRKYFNHWHYILLKRKASIQQSIFLKMFISDKIKQHQYYAIVKMINFSNAVSNSKREKQSEKAKVNVNVVQDMIIDVKEVSKRLQFEEESSKKIDYDELDIEDTQLEDGDYYQMKRQYKNNLKAKDMPRQRKEFSFEKNDHLGLDQNYFLSIDKNDMTAHFNKFNLFSKGKDSNLTTNSEFKTKQRSHYHNHYANDDDPPEAFTLDPQFNTRNVSMNTGDHSRHTSGANKNQIPTPKQQDNKENIVQMSQASKMKVNIQNEISPTNNCKNYQRHTQLNKNYEQSDPFELPNNEEEINFPKYVNKQNDDYAQFIDKYFDKPVNADQRVKKEEKVIQKETDARYSFKHVVPFNPIDDTPSDTYLRYKANNQDSETKQKSIPSQKPGQKVFESKKNSQISLTSSNQNQNKKEPFINNYFLKLSAQNSAKQDKSKPVLMEKQQNQIDAHQNQLSPKPQLVNSQAHKNNQQQPPSQASFVTSNNNIDFMHFHSHSDTSFVFFDGNKVQPNCILDNFWRESGISSASRLTNMGKTGPLMNQSFGTNSQLQNQYVSNIMKQAFQSRPTQQVTTPKNNRLQ